MGPRLPDGFTPEASEQGSAPHRRLRREVVDPLSALRCSGQRAGHLDALTQTRRSRRTTRKRMRRRLLSDGRTEDDRTEQDANVLRGKPRER